jgi:cell wall-associated NlpC family hydrolase
VHWPAVLKPAWVAVPVATVWNHPATARPQDAAAVAARPDVAGWLASLTFRQKLGLDDLVATQALLYQPVLVVGRKAAWAHVVVEGQTGSVYPFGIAGWVPGAQLTYRAPPTGRIRVTVAVPDLRAGPLSLSYGTELPADPGPGRQVTVEVPQGRFSMPGSSVRSGPLAPSGPALVAEAERFLGLQYMWAGTSGFGFDCSGLAYTVYRQFGVVLPRDAADQARAGRQVAPSELEPGDLVFFAFDGTVDHVGMYAGNGMMIDAPHTGASVELVPLWSAGRSHYYHGARRYI